MKVDWWIEMVTESGGWGWRGKMSGRGVGESELLVFAFAITVAHQRQTWPWCKYDGRGEEGEASCTLEIRMGVRTKCLLRSMMRFHCPVASSFPFLNETETVTWGVKRVMLVRMQQFNALRPRRQNVIPKTQTRLLRSTRFMQPRVHAPLCVGHTSYAFRCFLNNKKKSWLK